MTLSRRAFMSASAVALAGCAPAAPFRDTRAAAFSAGAAAVDVTPRTLPVIINGSFTERQAAKITDPLFARAVALDDGSTRLVICVVDNLMLPRELCDEAKTRAAASTGVPLSRILISATHTHSAGSVMGCLGSDADPNYTRELVPGIVAAIEQAVANLAPAQAGFAVAQDHEHTHSRRWLTRPDKLLEDPFGVRNVSAMMHPGYQNPNFLGPSGPVDPDLSMLALRSLDGRPIAVLANYSMHYVGASPVSADYFGRFCQRFEQQVNTPGFVAMMSQGTSGDLHWMNYARPKPNPLPTADSYAQEVIAVALPLYESVTYRRDVSLAMAETKLKLKRRVPDEKRLTWAREMMKKLGERKPTTRPEIYAREQLLLAAEPERELILQAVRIGEMGITALPNEVFAITGLKLKLQSPLQPTMNIALANGAEGYIPPPEQHFLGGYTTWAARTAGLEEQAEPRIIDAVLKLLEQVAGRSRARLTEDKPDYAAAVLASKPQAYWRLSNPYHDAPVRDVTGRGRDAQLELGAAMYLEGPQGPAFGGVRGVNRAVQFANGRMRAFVEVPRRDYSVELWLCNYLAADVRDVTGYCFSRAAEEKGAPGDSLGITGKSAGSAAGRLFVTNGDSLGGIVTGVTALEPRRWYHVLLTRAGRTVRVYLDGELEIDADLASTDLTSIRQLWFGGRSDKFANFEGRLDEIAVYDRALSQTEARRHLQAARGQPTKLDARD